MMFVVNFRWKIKTLLLMLSLSCCIFGAIAQQEITVLVPNFPPYTEKKHQQISGIGIDLANQVFNKTGIKVRYRILPNYAKVVQQITQGQGDAFLLASQNDERDSIAVFTEPLLINRWCWYVLRTDTISPDDSDFKDRATVSTHFNANTHKWLLKNNYFVDPVMDTGKLPHMLLRGRIDAVFIAELVFDEAIKQALITPQTFKKYVEIEKPFGIYLSKKYLAKYPDTLKRVNKAINALQP